MTCGSTKSDATLLTWNWTLYVMSSWHDDIKGVGVATMCTNHRTKNDIPKISGLDWIKLTTTPCKIWLGGLNP